MVRDKLVLDDFIAYTRTSFLDEGAFVSSDTRNALKGASDISELERRLGISGDAARKKSGIKGALDKKLTRDGEAKAAYDLLAATLVDPNTSKDLATVLDDLNKLGLSEAKKKLIRDRLVIEDYIHYTKTSFLNDRQLSSDEMKSALTGQSAALATLLSVPDSDDTKKKSKINPLLDQKIKADATAADVYSQLTRRLTLNNGNNDLIGALCTLDSNDSFCPAFAATNKAPFIPAAPVTVTLTGVKNVTADNFIARVLDGEIVVADNCKIKVSGETVTFEFVPTAANKKYTVRLVSADGFITAEKKEAVELVPFTAKIKETTPIQAGKETTFTITSEFEFRAGWKIKIPLPGLAPLDLTVTTNMLSPDKKSLTVKVTIPEQKK